MYWLLSVCVLLYIPLILSRKLASKETGDRTVLFKFSLFIAAFGAAIGLILVLIEGAKFSFGWVTISTALLFGVLLAVSQLASFYALQRTSVAVVNMSSTASVLIPCVFGVLFFRETLTLGNAVGIIAFLTAAYLITRTTDKTNQDVTMKGLLACLVVFLADGVGSVAMQLFSRYSVGVSASVFMLYGYLANALVLFVCLFAVKQRAGLEKIGNKTAIFPKKLFLFGAVAAGVAFAIQQINVVLANRISAAVLFPVLKSGSLIFGAVIGWAVFKEKLSVKNIIGVGCCILAVIVLNL